MAEKFVKGFPNLGNTCYLNSVIQSLLSSEFIVNGKMITQWRVHAGTMLRDLPRAYRLMNDFIKLIIDNEAVTNTHINEFVKSFHFYFNGLGFFKKYEFHDPVECFSKMMEYLSNHSKYIDAACNTRTWGAETLDCSLAIEIINRNICPNQHISDKREIINVLSVPLVFYENSAQVRQGISVLDCIEEFLKIEEMNDARNNIFCNRCNKEQPNSSKQLILNKVTEVFIIQLNRYAFRVSVLL